MNIGKYEILAELGKGGFGVVYKARDTTLDRVVALKMLHAQLTLDERFVQYFEREARSLAKIDHPNVVTIHEIGNFEGQVFIAMRYLANGNLAEKLRRKGPFRQNEAFKIFSQVCDGLSAGHKRGIVHRDVKPGNILFDEYGQAVVADFSIAKAVQMSTVVASSGSVGFAGTPSYMPPEMWDDGVVTPAVDQYSLACVLFEMLTGRKLFEGETTSKIMHKHFSPLVLPESLPADLRRILQKAVAFNPEDRYSSMDEFRRAVGTYEKNGSYLAQQPQVNLIVEPNPGLIDDLRKKSEKKPAGVSAKPNQAIRFPASFYWIIGGALAIILPATFLIRANLSFSVLGTEIDPTEVLPTGTLTITNEMSESTSAVAIAPTKTNLPTSTPEPTTDISNTRLRKIDGMEQVLIPGGSFTMGSDFDEEREKPQHTVWLDTYWIDKFEVTNAQYAICVSAGACDSPDYRNSLTQDRYYGNANFENFPVLFVSWYDATNYCGWVGGRLPTEAEWEKAARGDQDARMFPWGDNFASNYANLCDQNCTMSWKNRDYDDGFIDTAPVTDFPDGISQFGAMNMSGNVCEWVADWYKADYFFIKQDWSEPTGPTSGSTRVIKGGSWYDDTDILRVSARYGFDPIKSFYDVGFRCVIEP